MVISPLKIRALEGPTRDEGWRVPKRCQARFQKSPSANGISHFQEKQRQNGALGEQGCSGGGNRTSLPGNI